MARLVEEILGRPVSQGRIRDEVERLVHTRGFDAVRATVAENLAHITSKAGALLQAQGIFFVVATYVLDHGWPRYVTLASMFLLLAAALLLLPVLRSVFIGAAPGKALDHEAELHVLVRSAQTLSRRGGIFNVSLYLTFVSIALLGVGALTLTR